MLTIAVSSRSLFHLEDANDIFERDGQLAYDAFMRDTEDQPLQPGMAFELVRKLLNLNQYTPLEQSERGEQLVNVVLLSRNSPDAGVRVMRSVSLHGLPIERAVFTAGGNRFRYAHALKADLFLSASASDAKLALANGLAAASIVPRSRKPDPLPGIPCDRKDEVIRIAFDGDSVLFSDESDRIYREHGLERFKAHEIERANVPLGEGPFKKLLDKLSDVQKAISMNKASPRSPLHIGLVTARGVQSHARVLNTLRSWGISVDEVVFASGAPKGPLLRAFEADFFFDDTGRHVESALENDIAAAQVHFGEGGLPERAEELRLSVAAAAKTVASATITRRRLASARA